MGRKSWYSLRPQHKLVISPMLVERFKNKLRMFWQRLCGLNLPQVGYSFPFRISIIDGSSGRCRPKEMGTNETKAASSQMALIVARTTVRVTQRVYLRAKFMWKFLSTWRAVKQWTNVCLTKKKVIFFDLCSIPGEQVNGSSLNNQAPYRITRSHLGFNAKIHSSFSCTLLSVKLFTSGDLLCVYNDLGI